MVSDIKVKAINLRIFIFYDKGFVNQNLYISHECLIRVYVDYHTVGNFRGSNFSWFGELR